VNVLLVYESMYGNTAHIAEAVGEGLTHDGSTVAMRNVDDVADVDPGSFDLLVVGGPTHAHSMSRTATRRTAIDDQKNTYEDPTLGDGLRAWLEGLTTVAGRRAAAFDTRFDKPSILVGEASKGIEKRLHHNGYHVLERKSFFVDPKNELLEGELHRAQAWGRALVSQLAPAQ
jgi:flavodoxin